MQLGVVSRFAQEEASSATQITARQKENNKCEKIYKVFDNYMESC